MEEQIKQPWKLLKNEAGEPKAYPYVTVSGFAYDSACNFPLLFRGPKVRSVPNVWSLPSGLHEAGLTIEEQFTAELFQELNLEVIPNTCSRVGLYENIPGDGFHWVIVILAAQVKTLSTITNKEPDKHPEIKIASVHDVIDVNSSFWKLAWAPTLFKALKDNRHSIANSMGFVCAP